jgi:hypothetical protein
LVAEAEFTKLAFIKDVAVGEEQAMFVQFSHVFPLLPYDTASERRNRLLLCMQYFSEER